MDLLGVYASCWQEIQRRVWRCMLLWLFVFAICFCCRYSLLTALRWPLTTALTTVPPVVSLSVLDGVYVTFEVALLFSLLLCMPVFLSQAWCFLSPALHAQERMFLRMVLGLGGGLFCLGLVVGWWVVLPCLFQYAQFFFPSDMVWLIDLRHYLSLCWCVVVYTGMVFELPLLVLFFSYYDWIAVSTVQRCRPYVFVGCFVIGMLMTPPDVLLQIAFALPLYALFELGWVMSVVLKRFFRPGSTLVTSQ